jgi:hypothetical protein
MGNVDPLTLPQAVSTGKSAAEKAETRIDLAEIIGLPDFEVSRPSLNWVYMRSVLCVKLIWV